MNKIMMLGNLSIEQIQKRCGIDFPEEVIKYLKETYQPNANIGDGKEEWHGFDIPFCIYCGNIEMATYIRDELSELDWSKCKESLQIMYYRREGE